MVFDLALDSNHCKNGKRHEAHSSKKCLFAIPMYIEFSLYVYSLCKFYIILHYDLSYVANVQF